MYLDNTEFKVGQGDIGHNLSWSVGHGVFAMGPQPAGSMPRRRPREPTIL